jgi:NAD+ synthase
MVETFVNAVGLQPQAGNRSMAQDVDRVRLGNIMARVRMVAVFDYARENSALVLGTENKSEHYLGYYTRFGDEASDIEPLRSLYKTEI